MAPNLLVKAAFVRGDLDSEKTSCNSTKIECDDLSPIRTDFVLKNIYSYLIKNGANFSPPSPINNEEGTVMNDLEEIADAFKQNYVGTIRKLCSEIEVTLDTLGSVLSGVSNELFCEGITWSRIVALFVFVGELTLQCLAKKYPMEIIDVMFECFQKLVKEDLKDWIIDHGGWDGIRSLSKTQSGGSRLSERTDDSSVKGWAKSLLHGTVRMIGTLAKIANSTSQTLP